MQGEIEQWLGRLGSSDPTPGGGAAAALAVAAGASLVEMVANLTVGRKAYAEHEDHVRPIGEEAARLRVQGWELAAEDEEAFNAVMAAYGLPKGSDDERATRTREIERATADAARPPMRVAEVAARVIDLAAGLPGRSNRNVLSDVGVAASLAVAALESAAINVEVNLAGLKDAATRADLRKELDGHLAAGERGRRLVADVRAGING